MRAVPTLVAAWLADGKKPYANRRQAYYAIAKALTVAKYPAWITSCPLDEAIWHGESQGWTPRLISLRRNKARRLFFVTEQYETNDGGGNAFDDRRWVVFVRRVARFLEWVDDRRAIEAKLAHIPTDDLEGREQYCEKLAQDFMNASIHYRNELARRSAR